MATNTYIENQGFYIHVFYLAVPPPQLLPLHMSHISFIYKLNLFPWNLGSISMELSVKWKYNKC